MPNEKGKFFSHFQCLLFLHIFNLFVNLVISSAPKSAMIFCKSGSKKLAQTLLCAAWLPLKFCRYFACFSKPNKKWSCQTTITYGAVDCCHTRVNVNVSNEIQTNKQTNASLFMGSMSGSAGLSWLQPWPQPGQVPGCWRRWSKGWRCWSRWSTSWRCWRRWSTSWRCCTTVWE